MSSYHLTQFSFVIFCLLLCHLVSSLCKAVSRSLRSAITDLHETDKKLYLGNGMAGTVPDTLNKGQYQHGYLLIMDFGLV